jgi:hypothetical protein
VNRRVGSPLGSLAVRTGGHLDTGRLVRDPARRSRGPTCRRTPTLNTPRRPS